LSITIRPERAGEEAAVRAVNEAAFGGTFEGGIVDGIRGTDRWIDGGSLVAEVDAGGLVGHLLLSEGDLDLAGGGTRRIWMVGPVAVIPGRQREGIGSALVQAAIAFAKARDQPILCLLGHATYYPRFGFEPARAIGIEPPRPWPDASWLALRLPAWDPTVRGIGRFPPAFPDSS
jgi:putative acetyltransferase